jgi:hypothetical protein
MSGFNSEDFLDDKDIDRIIEELYANEQKRLKRTRIDRDEYAPSAPPMHLMRPMQSMRPPPPPPPPNRSYSLPITGFDIAEFINSNASNTRKSRLKILDSHKHDFEKQKNVYENEIKAFRDKIKELQKKLKDIDVDIKKVNTDMLNLLENE